MENKKSKRGGARKGAGAPKKENKKTETLSIRATKEHMILLDECSKKLNITRSNTIVKAIEDLYKKLNN